MSLLNSLAAILTRVGTDLEPAVTITKNGGRGTQRWLDTGTADGLVGGYVSVFIDAMFITWNQVAGVDYIPVVFGEVVTRESQSHAVLRRAPFVAETKDVNSLVNTGGWVNGSLSVLQYIPVAATTLSMDLGLKAVESRDIVAGISGLVGALAEGLVGGVAKEGMDVLSKTAEKASDVLVTLLTFDQGPVRLMGHSDIELDQVGLGESTLLWVAAPATGSLPGLQYRHAERTLVLEDGTPYTGSSYVVFRFRRVTEFPGVDVTLREVRDTLKKLGDLLSRGIEANEEPQVMLRMARMMILQDSLSFERFTGPDVDRIQELLFTQLNRMAQKAGLQDGPGTGDVAGLLPRASDAVRALEGHTRHQAYRDAVESWRSGTALTDPGAEQ